MSAEREIRGGEVVTYLLWIVVLYVGATSAMNHLRRVDVMERRLETVEALVVRLNPRPEPAP